MKREGECVCASSDTQQQRAQQSREQCSPQACVLNRTSVTFSTEGPLLEFSMLEILEGFFDYLKRISFVLIKFFKINRITINYRNNQIRLTTQMGGFVVDSSFI